MFADRIDAGRQLAERLVHLRHEDAVVVGLPRGGIPVAYEVAKVLEAPLDVILVRKLGVPFQPELAMGAIGEGGERVIDTDVVELAGISDRELEVDRANVFDIELLGGSVANPRSQVYRSATSVPARVQPRRSGPRPLRIQR